MVMAGGLGLFQVPWKANPVLPALNDLWFGPSEAKAWLRQLFRWPRAAPHNRAPRMAVRVLPAGIFAARQVPACPGPAYAAQKRKWQPRLDRRDSWRRLPPPTGRPCAHRFSTTVPWPLEIGRAHV